MFRIILFSFIALAFASCEKEVENVKLPKTYGEKLVVECFISPESDSVSAIVTLSVPLFGEKKEGPIQSLKDAMVTLSNGTNSFNIPFDTEKETFFAKTIPFSILPGNTYNLTVSYTDSKIVTAKCTVPKTAAIPTQFTVTKSSSTSSFDNYSNETIKAEWQDIAGERNYYMVTMSSSEIYNGDRFAQSIYLLNNLLSDEQEDGKLITYREEYNTGSMYIDRVDELNLFTLDYNSYQFFKTQGLSENQGPFTTPASVHSNIQNGLGVFGAYRKRTLIK